MILNWLLSKLILLTQSIVLYFIVPQCEIPTCFINTPLKPVGKIGEESVGGTCLLWLSIALYDPSLKVLKSWKDLHSCFAGYIEMKDAKVSAPCRHECLLIIMYTLWLSQYIRNVFVFLARCPLKPLDFVPVCGGRPSLSSPVDYPSHDALGPCGRTLSIPFPCSELYWLFEFIVSLCLGMIRLAH